MPASYALRIVSGYRGQAGYVRAARAEPSRALEALWARHAVDPYWQEWAAGQFNEARTREQMKSSIRDLEGLAVEVELLAQSGVERIVEAAYARIAEALPPFVPNPVICLYALDPANAFVRDRMNGVVGTGVGDNTLLQINPTAADWQAWLPYVLAHEHHHSVWGYNYFALKGHAGANLLTGLLIDGQADSFAHTLYPELPEPAWVTALDAGAEAEQWRIMQPYLGGSDGSAYVRFMFGDPAAGTPGSTGYTIGYRIVQAYLRRHPETGVIGLLDMDPHRILAESGYGGPPGDNG